LIVCIFHVVQRKKMLVQHSFVNLAYRTDTDWLLVKCSKYFVKRTLKHALQDSAGVGH
jgi:hypothetical protein